MPIKPRPDNKFSVNSLLDLARARQRMSSDRELAGALNVGSSAVSNWRYGNSHPSPMTCMRLAEMANLPLGLVLGTIGAAYAPNEEDAAVWRKLAEEAGGEAAGPWKVKVEKSITRQTRGAASRGTGSFGTRR